MKWFSSRTFRPQSVLACPNCKHALEVKSNSGRFANPLYEIFSGEVLHAASNSFNLKYSWECSSCAFPINIEKNADKRMIRLSFPYDWIIAGADSTAWVKWKVKQLNTFTAGLIDPAASYSDASNPVAVSFALFVEGQLDLDNLKVLDIGCGPLKMPIYLRTASRISLFGIEPFDSRFEGNLISSSSESLPFLNDMFDVVIASSVVDHFLDWQLSLRETSRVLRKNGKLIMYQHLSNQNVKYNGTHIDGNWYRIFENGYLAELEYETDDPFHTEVSQSIDWDIEISKYLTSMGFMLQIESPKEGFSIWVKA